MDDLATWFGIGFIMGVVCTILLAALEVSGMNRSDDEN